MERELKNTVPQKTGEGNENARTQMWNRIKRKPILICRQQ